MAVLVAFASTFICLVIAIALKIWNVQPWVPRRNNIMTTRISDRIVEYCTSTASVTEQYASSLKHLGSAAATPASAAKKLFGHHVKSVSTDPPKSREPATEDDLQRAYACGNWCEDKGGKRPSELFLRCWHDALCTLEDDPLVGCVSPKLMGSHGTVPLAVFAPLPDICRHMSNLIVRAEKEVILATNYWMNSDASALISDAIRELSKRAGARGERASVKIIYDRGHLKQVVDSHTVVDATEFSGPKIALPKPEEIPNVDLHVMNFHRIILGTFHPKFMVVDRRIAIVQSNNIQDNDNVEMMAEVQGPIVDALYDYALISWDKAIGPPPLPMIDSPATAATAEIPCFADKAFDDLTAMQARLTSSSPFFGPGEQRPPEHRPTDPHYDDDLAGEVVRIEASWTAPDGGSAVETVARCLNRSTHLSTEATAPEVAHAQRMTPYILTPSRDVYPIAMVGRKPWGAPNHSSVYTPQNEAWLSALRNAKRDVFIQSPNLNAAPLVPAIVDAVRRGVKVTYYVCLGYNDAGELLPMQGGTNEMMANKLYNELRKDSNWQELKERLVICYYVGKDQDKPIHNKFKKRSCHVKLLIADHHLAIVGSGNQDTQSWYHSQEVNLMIDSEQVCEAWLDGALRNQNSHMYGIASHEDGLWRDKDGNQAEGSVGADPGRFSWLKGILGAIDRVRGVGGF